MKPWHCVVAALYLLALTALTLPLLLVARVEPGSASRIFSVWPYWLVLAALGACQWALLLVPVRIANRRPVTRGALWPTILVGGLMLALLTLAVSLCLYAASFGDNDAGLNPPWRILALGAVLWLLWGAVFHRLSRSCAPSDFVGMVCQRLVRGSIVELLVAVPCHIVVRSRDFCCAGVFTLFGLALGVSVMLLAFGPAVYFLFVARARRLQPTPSR